ncbi:hypothetical protein FisN_21Hh131 [Fistulifera solaris]|uniref:Uncharacterized protein n=1 Tax=Fistulifera solaris TaxID=1519565 RepID=A0A1Z5JRM8_FISSO|nr:hypothetical protein FisN_21Hh131 [Fistulifera solaris]|eukprot:GAX16690.1 hypothetical protein FisN_21Hh131 [Fistulifera solaris]
MTTTQHVRPKKRDSSVTAPTSSDSVSTEQSSVKGILKKSSKYTSSGVANNGALADDNAADSFQTAHTDFSSNRATIVQDFVVERPRQPRTKKKAEKSEKTDEPILSFNSISDLMEAAGSQLPPQLIEEGAVVEAGLEFSCCDPVEYHEESRDEQYRVFLGLQDDEEEKQVENKENTDSWDIMDDDNDDEESAVEARQFARDLLEEEKNGPNYEADDYYSDSGEEEECEAQPKPFLVLWKALAQWISPEAVAYVKQIRDGLSEAPVPERTTTVSDIEASRCSGLWSTLQMHVQSCWISLDETREEYPISQQRLICLLQLLDYQHPTPSLSIIMIKALTCILLDTVALSGSALPEPCERAGLQEEEYRYLVRQAFLSFSN